jgi:hypothetical protein
MMVVEVENMEERNTFEIFGILLGLGIWFNYVLDHIALAWSMIRKKPYKSVRQTEFENLMKYPSLAWIPLALAIGYSVWFLKLKI